MSRLIDLRGCDAGANRATWPYIGFLKMGAAMWHPRVLNIGGRTLLAPILRSERRGQSANVTRLLWDGSNSNETPELQKPNLNFELPFHSRGLISSRIANRCTGRTDRDCHLGNRTALRTATAPLGIKSDRNTEWNRETGALFRILSRHTGRDNVRIAAQGMLSARAGTPKPTRKDSRSAPARSLPASSRLLKVLPSHINIFYNGAPPSAATGAAAMANARLSRGGARRQEFLGSIAPHRRSDRQSVVGDKAPEEGRVKLPAPSSVFGSDIRIGVMQHDWDESNDSRSRPGKNINGTLYVDGSTLSQWLITHLGQEVGRAHTGTTAVDRRTVSPWSVPNVAM